MRRIQGNARTTPDVAAPKLCDLALNYPTLFEFLTDTMYEDGSLRTPGSLTVFTDDEGALKACLNDKDSAAVTFVTASTLTDLLTRANDCILAPHTDWRKSKFAKPRKK